MSEVHGTKFQCSHCQADMEFEYVIHNGKGEIKFLGTCHHCDKQSAFSLDKVVAQLYGLTDEMKPMEWN